MDEIKTENSNNGGGGEEEAGKIQPRKIKTYEKDIISFYFGLFA